MAPGTRVAVVTSGGDAPGMNAALRAIVLELHVRGLVAWGVRHRFAGLGRGDWHPLAPSDVEGIDAEAGTILGSARSESFRLEESVEETATRMRTAGLNRLIAIGGNGTQRGAEALGRHDIAVVGVASTIDNDVPGIDRSIGCATAAATVLEAIDRLRATARSHRRVALVETMGRGSGWLALAAGIAGCADAIVCPEVDLSPPDVAGLLTDAWRSGRRGLVVVVAEGSTHTIGEIAHHLEYVAKPGWETRTTILGHVQRGARPAWEDRCLGRKAGVAAAQAMRAPRPAGIAGIANGEFGPHVFADPHPPTVATQEWIALAPRPRES
ncbi:MAG: 6-phosphofructokinase [Armatimonadota bacterium]